ncbi:MAG: cyclic nucleotide-binding domain-containing protein [Leptospiraceae bacterium]|nr:cyclic nucleotide-binding domain-containing protein [Leptospiraceae bacterium]
MSLNIFEYVNNLAVDIRKVDDVVFEQDEPSDGKMYFVAEGELAVIRSIDGQPHVLNRLQPGDFFGEMAILNRKPRAATVKVVSRTAKLGYLDEGMFMRIARSSPVFHYSLLKLVIQRIGMIEDTIDETTKQLEELKSK